jgi:hypothetical protein
VTEFRTDLNNNPTAMIFALAAEGGLALNTEYVEGTPFESGGVTYYTAKLIGDPIQLTIRVITSVGYYTPTGQQRWSYIGMPRFIWDALTPAQQRDVIGYQYQYEGGTAMRNLFPNYGKP